jgi:hypothetical protein
VTASKQPSSAPKPSQRTRRSKWFVDTLKEELVKIGVTSIIDALKGTEHVHVALIVGDFACAIRHTVVFEDAPLAIQAALQAARLRG